MNPNLNPAAHAQMVQRTVRPKFRGHARIVANVAPHYPRTIEREYQRIMNATLSEVKRVFRDHLPTIQSAFADETRTNLTTDPTGRWLRLDAGGEGTIAGAFREMIETFLGSKVYGGLPAKLSALAERTRKLSIREWKRVVKATLGIDLIDDFYNGELYQQMLRQWTQTNISLIQTIPRDALSKMETIVLDGYRNGATVSSIAKAVQQQFDTSKSYAKFVARDQVAKLNAQITRQQHTDAGVEAYVWRTAGDERVRARHAELNDTQHRWDDPPQVGGKVSRYCHPGEDYQCRCVALPILELEGLDLPWDGAKSGLTNLPGSGIIGARINTIMNGAGSVNENHSSREMALGMRKPPSTVLSDEDIQSLREDIRAIQADERVFVFNSNLVRGTSYRDDLDLDLVLVRGNVLPDLESGSTHPRDLMSPRAVLAHEYYGHRENRENHIPARDWQDEYRASYDAAKHAPGLSDEDRRYLLLDAIERKREAGETIEYDDFMRSVLYGYDGYAEIDS